MSDESRGDGEQNKAEAMKTSASHLEFQGPEQSAPSILRVAPVFSMLRRAVQR